MVARLAVVYDRDLLPRAAPLKPGAPALARNLDPRP